MSALNNPAIEDRLAALRKSYGAALHENIERLQRSTRDIHPNDEKRTRASLDEARAISHKLAGSSPTFGFVRIGQLARALEECLDNIVASGALPGEGDRRDIENLLREIMREEEKSRPASASAAEKEPVAETLGADAKPRSTSTQTHRLLIAQDRNLFAFDFLRSLERCGFEMQVGDEVASWVSHAQAFRPDALIVELGPDKAEGLELAAKLWNDEAFHRLEIFFFVKSPEFLNKILLSGISDEWFIYPPLDSEALALRILRRVFDVKVGRGPNNRPYLARYLDVLKRLAVPDGDPIPGAPSEQPAVAAAAPVVTAPSIAMASPVVVAPLAVAPSPTLAPAEPDMPNFDLTLARMRVLVVDDDRHLVEAISEVVSALGVKVMKAHSGFQGVQLATKEPPDLIITDFEMPNGSAEYLLSNLRKSAAAKSLKVIIMTSERVIRKYQLSSDLASQLKADTCLPKPLDLTNLCVEVKRLLAEAERERISRKAQIAQVVKRL